MTRPRALGLLAAGAGLAALVAVLAWRLGPGPLATAEDFAGSSSSESGLAGGNAAPSAGVGARAARDEGSAGSGESALPAAGARAAVAGPASSAEDAVLWKGFVVDAANEAPLEGAQVRARQGQRELAALTDAQGRFELALAADAPGAPPAQAEIAHPAYVSVRIAEVDPSVERFALVRAGAVAGTLRGPGLADSEGAAKIVLWSEARDGSGEIAIATGTCGAAGHFQVEGLAPGTWSLAAAGARSVVALHAGLAVHTGATTEIDLDLERGAQLSGRITERAADGSAGRALPGARAALTWRGSGVPGEVEELFARQAVAGAGGHYEIEGLTPGSSRVDLDADGGLALAATVEVAASAERLERDFALGGPAGLAGSVVDQLGRPVQGARIALLAGDDASSDLELAELEARVAAQSDARGSFALGGLPGQERIVLVALPPAGDEQSSASRAGEWRLQPGQVLEDARLVLEGATELGGFVVTALDEPIEGARVEVLQRTGRGGRVTLHSAASDALGAFAFAGVPTGSLDLSVEAEGFAPLRRRLRLSSGAPHSERVVLEPASLVTAWVRDERGYALEGVRVRLLQRDEEGRRTDQHIERTDAYGSATFEDVREGVWELSAWADDYELEELSSPTLSVPEQDSFEVELRAKFEARASLRGQAIVLPHSAPATQLEFEGIGSAVVAFDAGTFEITGLEPRPTDFVLSAEGCMPLALPLELSAGVELDLGVLALEPAFAVEVRLVEADGGESVHDARAHLERGHPPDPKKAGAGPKNGTPPKRATIRLREQRPGRYSAERVAEGPWTLVVERKGRPRFEQPIEVRAEAEQVLRVRVP